MKEFAFCCVINIYIKYSLVIPLKDKKRIAITKFSDDSGRKPSKTWVDKGSEFYNRLINSWLEKNDIEMYSTHNERKSVVTENYKYFCKMYN